MNVSDQSIAGQLRRMEKPVIVVSNKIDGVNADVASIGFHSFALGSPVQISAAHGRGVLELLERVDTLLPVIEESSEEQDKGILCQDEGCQYRPRWRYISCFHRSQAVAGH